MNDRPGERVAGKNETVYDWRHCFPPAQREPGAAQRHAFLGTAEPLNRSCLVRVLALIPVSGLEAAEQVRTALQTVKPTRAEAATRLKRKLGLHLNDY